MCYSTLVDPRTKVLHIEQYRRLSLMERWDVQVPIIVMTVNTIRENRIFCLAPGYEHHLSKFVQLY